MSVFQIVLAFCDITGVIRYRMRYVITGHGCNTKDCNRSGSLDINSLFITRCKTAVKISGVTTIGRYLFHSNCHFLLCIRIVCHVSQKYKYLLSCKCKLLCNSKGHIRYECTLYNRIGCSMNKHNCMTHCSALFKCVAECKIIVIFQTHTSKYDNIYFCL